MLISIVEFELDISEVETQPETHKKMSKLIKNSVLCCEKLLENYSENRVSFYSRVVLCGEPNVGKSTLLNSLLGQERAIVSATPGTTRDRIEVDLDLEQTRITLIDTAGTRETKDNIEMSGIEKTQYSSPNMRQMTSRITIGDLNHIKEKEGKTKIF